MAKFYATNWTAAVAVPTGIPVPSGDGGGSERAYYDEFVAVAGMAVNDTIDFGPPSGALQPGDRVVGADIVTDAAAAAMLLALGDDGSATRFITATAAAAAGRITLNNYANYGWQVDQQRPIRMTITGAAPPVGNKIRVKVLVLRS